MAIPAILATVAGGLVSSLVQHALGAATDRTAETTQSVSREDFSKLLARAERQDAVAGLGQANGGSTGLTAAAVGQGGRTGAASLLGKTVAVNGSPVALDGGNSALLRYTLPAAAKTVKLEVVDGHGTVVRTVNVGQQGGGQHRVVFDGLADDGTRLPAGTYTYRVAACDNAGNALSGSFTEVGAVTGVTDGGGVPALHIGDRRVPLGWVVGVVPPSRV